MKVICENCKKEFNKKPSQVKKTKSNYCSHSCAASCTNKQRAVKSICSCGGTKDYASQFCRTCLIKNNISKMFSSPISDYFLSSNARIKYARIRTWARKVLDYYKTPKHCSICGFDVHVEACHIKPISSFTETSLMSEVNGLDNLVYLCPNHHIMLDKGLITPAEVRTRKPSD